MRTNPMLRALMSALAVAVIVAPASAQQDPRVGLSAGYSNAGVAAKNFELVSNTPRTAGFVAAPRAFPDNFPPVYQDIMYANSDFAFRGNTVFMGNFRGWEAYDVSNAKAPKLISQTVCPGGQGDVSIYKNLLFMSVEMPNGRTDCSDVPIASMMQPNAPTPETLFMGVRIFDISNLAKPKQVAFVQTCRGSHTHTLVTDPKDPANVYIYVSGVGHPRQGEKGMESCSAVADPTKDPNTSYFRIDVIKVPVAAPQNAKIVSNPRIFADSAGNIAGLWKGGKMNDSTQAAARTDQCHDITVYQGIGLAAGACAGNGVLLDVSNPASPKRIDAVYDPNFAYWHSANFNNDGSKLLFTDEWGGGMQPNCQAGQRNTWGADAIFALNNRKLALQSYYKLPAPQSKTENCVAHNGSLIPIPGRDVLVQAWYQGGISVVDFTDAKNPTEVAYFDRGAYNADTLHLGGYWSAYWYNGHVYGSEIGRGLDILDLKAGDNLTQNEIDAAKLAVLPEWNPQSQVKITWPAKPVVAQALLDGLQRSGVDVSNARKHLDMGHFAVTANEVKKLNVTSDADKNRVAMLTGLLAKMK